MRIKRVLFTHITVRSLSEVQEVAQFLSGEALPRIVLGSVLQKSSAGSSGSTVGIINLTPYDAWLEKTCHKGFDGITFKTVSLSKSLPTTQYVEKTLALDLLEDRFLKMLLMEMVFRQDFQ